METIQKEIYPKVDELATNTFELIFAIKMQRIMGKVNLSQVIERIQSKLQTDTPDTTDLIREMREKEYAC